MRRFVAAVLLITFLGQTSGSASAATPEMAAQVRFDVLSAITPLRAAIVGSQVYAVFTGGDDRWAMIHAPAPRTTRHENIADVPHPRPVTIVKPIITAGVPHYVALPKHPPRRFVKDPWAMGGNRISGTPVRFQPLRPLAPHAHTVAQRTQTANRRLGPTLFEAGNAKAERSAVSPSYATSPGGIAIATTDAGAGVTPWWSFVSHSIPGIGTALANVAYGNLVIAASDVDIPERGVDLAFHRYYNSQSRHDYGNGTASDDAGEPAIFGNYWTNNYDAHIVFHPAGTTYAGTHFQANTISVYDATGFRCDYTSNGVGGWNPCAGVHATLDVDPTNICDYWLTQTDGTAQYFHQDDATNPSCGDNPGKMGRLYEIVGRNSNNSVTLNYSYYPNASSDQNITKIVVAHSDTDQLTLTFGKVNNHLELYQITRPDGATLQYDYDAYGDLVEVDKPGNGNTVTTVPSGHPSIPSGDLPEYYTPGGAPLGPVYIVCGPRATVSTWANAPNAFTDGACMELAYDNNLAVTQWKVDGVLNFKPSNDGTGTALDPNMWGAEGAWYYAYFVYGAQNNSACGNTTMSTTWCDSNGLNTGWFVDGSGRMMTQSSWTGKPEALWLVSTQRWDADNNLTTSQNVQEYQANTSTTYQYDSGGMPTLIQLPKVPLSDGTQTHPTYTFTYDSFENLTASCDPVYNASHSGSCPTTPGSGAQVYKYGFGDAAEPNGKITDAYTPSGYHYSYAYNYNSSDEPGDYGLPTKIQGDQFSQSADNSSRTPVQSFVYDSAGSVTAHGLGNGQSQMSYDNLHRVTSVTDPDGVVSYTCYFPDGSVQAQEGAQQYKMDVAAGHTPCTSGGAAASNSYALRFYYDSDGDRTDEAHYYGNAASDTQRWYDGLDRLVEVKIPGDSNDSGDKPLIRRYLYDLTQSSGTATVSIAGNASQYSAFGNIFKTQSWFTIPGASKSSWNDVDGNAYDAQGRPTMRFQNTPTTDANLATPSPAPGQNPGGLKVWSGSYDQTGQVGLLATSTDPMGVTTNYAYSPVGELISEAFSDSTPRETFGYDADGRLGSASSSVASDAYVWNPDGTLKSDTEGGVANPATMSYAYYPDGTRQTLTISDNGVFSQTRQYTYRTDGMRKYLSVSGVANPFTWTYTNAGRMQSQSDPQTGSGPFSSPAYTGSVTIVPKSQQFDGAGLLATLTMPDGLKEKFTYDAESEPTGLSVDATGFGLNVPSGLSNSFVTGTQYSYDIRGELYLTQASSPQASNQAIQLQTFNFGHPLPCDLTSSNPCTEFPPPIVDGLTGALYSFQDSDPANSSTVCETISYDKDGRQASDIEVPKGDTGGCSTGGGVAGQWNYDALNHTTSDVVCPTTCSSKNTYTWDALGKLRTYSDGSHTYTLHWDGSDLLFVSNGAGVLQQFNIEKLAERNLDNSGNLQSLVVYDRDFSGSVVEKHTYQSDSGVDVTPDHFGLNKLGLSGIPNITGTWPSSGSSPVAPPLIDMQRTDGYQVGDLTVQGVRAYDANTQQWTTPDDYKGDVENPMTQRPYQWNGGNPITSSDPSGYFTNYPQPRTDTCATQPFAPGCGPQLDPIPEPMPAPRPAPMVISSQVVHCHGCTRPRLNASNIDVAHMQIGFGPIPASLLTGLFAEEAAASTFTETGELSQDAIAGSTKIIDASKLGNPAIPQGFSKFSTTTQVSPSGPFQVHFYMDSNGTVFYGLDYKAVFLGVGAP